MSIDLATISEKVGSGTVIMFKNFKVYIIMSIIMFMFYGVPGMVTNYVSKYCESSSNMNWTQINST